MDLQNGYGSDTNLF